MEKEGTRTTIEFPDCPGCATFADADEDPVAVAREALEAWLEAQLEDGAEIQRPSETIKIHRGAVPQSVAVTPTLAARLQIRLAREGAGVSQAELADRMGVPRQQVSRLESKDK
jgi:antitoxin HicB